MLGTREDMSTESGVTVSDETSILLEARPSADEMGKQREVVATLVKFLKVSYFTDIELSHRQCSLPGKCPLDTCLATVMGCEF